MSTPSPLDLILAKVKVPNSVGRSACSIILSAVLTQGFKFLLNIFKFLFHQFLYSGIYTSRLIRMKFFCQLEVCLFNFALRRGCGYSQNVVISHRFILKLNLLKTSRAKVRATSR